MKNKINVDLLLKNERSTIDRLDSIILNALIERFEVTNRIGLIKAENNLSAFDSVRENEQMQRLNQLVKDSGLDVKFVEQVMKLITSETKKRHKKLKEKKIGDYINEY